MSLVQVLLGILIQVYIIKGATYTIKDLEISNINEVDAPGLADAYVVMTPLVIGPACTPSSITTLPIPENNNPFFGTYTFSGCTVRDFKFEAFEEDNPPADPDDILLVGPNVIKAPPIGGSVPVTIWTVTGGLLQATIEAL